MEQILLGGIMFFGIETSVATKKEERKEKERRKYCDFYFWLLGHDSKMMPHS